MKNLFAFVLFYGLLTNTLLAQNWGNNKKDAKLFNHLLQETSSAINSRAAVDAPYDTAVIDDILLFVQNNQSDKRAYYFLLQLCWNHPNIYCSLSDDLKVNVLCSGFAQATNANTWGQIRRLTLAGRLLVDLGSKTLPCLYSLLNDTTRLAYGWNFDSKSMAIEEKWRKKDFAYHYAALIVGDEPTIPEYPQSRDVIIKQFNDNGLKALSEKSEKNALKIKNDVFNHLLKHPKDYDYLFSVQRSYPHIYCLLSDEFKENILCEAFFEAKIVNPKWGDLRSNSNNGQYGRLLIDLGTKMLPCLMLSLKDTSGMSWSAIESTNWRKKDFAYKYMAFIMGEKPVYTKDVEKRDAAIEAFIARLKKK